MLELKFDARKQLKIRLRAQSPMIHFQACDGGPNGVTQKTNGKETTGHIGGGLSGVTLRASEVRPQLDKYIFRRIAGIAPGEEFSADHLLKVKKDLLKREEYQDIFSDPEKANYALKYKMSIQVDADAKVTCVTLENEKKYSAYMSFFGNAGKTPRMMGVLCDPILTITCFNEHVRGLIVKYLKDFFFVTNFGTRQGKGFGSYVLDGSEREEANVVQALKENYGAKACYRMQVKNPSKERCFADYFDNIGNFAQIMKSGINHKVYIKGYIFKYMLENKTSIGNDKKWMKINGILPCDSIRSNDVNGNYKYVRAMLGTTNRIKIKNETEIEIKDAGKDNTIFERVPSPVFYKIIDKNIYIVAGRIPKDLYNHVFAFAVKKSAQNKSPNSKSNSAKKSSGTLPTPDTFDIDDFMEKYVVYYNNEVDVKHLNFLKKVQEVS